MALALVATFVMSLVSTGVGAWLQQPGWITALVTAGVDALTALVTLHPLRPVAPHYQPVPPSQLLGYATRWLGHAVGVGLLGAGAFGATVVGVTAFEEVRGLTLFNDQSEARTFEGVEPVAPAVEWVKDRIDPTPTTTPTPTHPTPSGSNGPDLVEVPDVIGQTTAQAEALLAKDFQVEPNVVPNVAEADTVVDTDPQPGTEVPRGSPVTLLVSTGPVEVPDVIGMSLVEATQRLEGAKLIAVDSEPIYSRFALGLVIDQDPDADTLAAPGSPVTLTRSIGPDSDPQDPDLPDYPIPPRDDVEIPEEGRVYDDQQR